MKTNEYITSDTHFGHANIIQYSNRPFPTRPADFSAIEKRVRDSDPTVSEEDKKRLKRWLQNHVHEMDEELIRRWNAKVPPGSIVYHLGDFAFMQEDKLINLVGRLNGTIRLLLGNHDKPIKGRVKNCFEWVRTYYECWTDSPKIKICMFHYPIASWNKGHHGSWQLHGHCHGSFPDTGVKRIDVGVDTHPNYEPYSFHEIKAKMEGRGWDALDHHKGRSVR